MTATPNPHWPEDAEKSVIGAVFLRHDAYDVAALEPEEFYSARHVFIWRAIGELRARRAAVDPVTVEHALGKRAPAVGGLVYLSELAEFVPTADNVQWYAEIVRKAALKRRVLAALDELRQLHARDDLEPEELLGEAWKRLGAVLKSRGSRAVELRDAVREALTDLGQALDRKRRGEAATWGIATGIEAIDDVIGGLEPGTVLVIAARPSMGKSSLLRQMLLGANDKGAGVHLFTLEDTRRRLGLRSIADVGRLDLHRMRTLKVEPEEYRRAVAAANELYQRERLLVDDSDGISTDDIAIEVRRHLRDNRTRIVAVDYLQKLQERGVKRGDAKVNVEVAMRGLCQLAKALDVAVVVCSQLSRKCEERPNKRPMLSDLRESGNIEAEADTVLALYRDEVYNADTDDTGIAELLVLKSKNGRTGLRKLAWDGPSASFRPLAGGVTRWA